MPDIKELLIDHSLPFTLEGKDITGRILRLSQTVDNILKAHQYPKEVNKILGQSLALATLLGSFMKYEGILMLQMKGSGAIRTLVVDYATDGKGEASLRGYAAYDDALADKIIPQSLENIFGEGYMMITIDQGKYMERYQGITALTGDNLACAAEEYFAVSEQVKTHVRLECEKNSDGAWRAGAMMIQHVAKKTTDQQKDAIQNTGADHHDENWHNAYVMLKSLKKSELLDDSLSLQTLLMRLYHEIGVRVFDPLKLVNGCRCSEQKLRSVISKFSPKELQDIAEEGIIKMTCEFCKTEHKFNVKNLIN